MRKIISTTLVCLLCTITIYGDNIDEANNLEKRIEVLSVGYDNVKKEVKRLSANSARDNYLIQDLRLDDKSLQDKIDSLSQVTDSITCAQSSDRVNFNDKLKDTNNSLASNKSAIASRTIWGIVVVVIFVLLLATVYFILNKMRKGASSIETTIGEVRKAQETLQAAQTKLQEDSVKLDNQLLEIAQRQIDDEKQKPEKPSALDHSLALKVADEIVRIEMNMSRMDPSIKGYKQLKKAVERIKDNFKANGYEFVEMLGMPYNEGMKVTANFVSDDTLEEGKQIITGITKPQINYNGRMIQAAQITVSQNI